MEEHIVVFEQYILDNCDRLVKFEDIDVLKWTSDEVFMDQFPRVEGVRVKACRAAGKLESGLLEFSTRWDLK